MDDIILLSIFIFVAGLLYSSVGHAGASGYLAAMALFGLAPEVMKPTALVLNVLVALIATAQFYRMGFFSWSVFLPFAVSSIPFAFIGGAISLPGSIYKQLLGLVLMFAAYRLFRYRQAAKTGAAKQVPVLVAVLSRAGTKQTASVSAAFILVNSIAGIAGCLMSVKFLPDAVYIWAFAAILGGIIGSELGSRRFVNATLYRLLAVVLVIAGAKLMLV
jgi:uncharacterized membrane protein YfcA